MGGFEGGDEAGFWDEESDLGLIFKPNKVTRFNLKHHMYSDEHCLTLDVYTPTGDCFAKLHFIKSFSNTFVVETPPETMYFKDAIVLAYNNLVDETNDFEIEEFFNAYKTMVELIEIIPKAHMQASLTAAFLLLTKETCNLILSTKELETIAKITHKEAPSFLSHYLN